MFKKLLSASAVISLTMSGLAVAESDPLKMDLSAQIVTLDVNGEEVFEPANSVAPGSTIEYRIQYENISDDPLEHFVVNGRIPNVTAFIADSAELDTSATFQARVEGIGWADVPVIRYLQDETGVLRAVTVSEDEYTGLRWKLAQPLGPGDEIEARYRVIVDQ